MISPVSFRDLMVHRAVLLLTSFPSATKPPPNSSENWAKPILSPFLTKTLLHWSALVAQAPVKSKAWACEGKKNPLQASKTHNPVDRLKLNIASPPSMGIRDLQVCCKRDACAWRPQVGSTNHRSRVSNIAQT